MRTKTGQIFQNKNTNKWVARVCYKNTNGKDTAIQKTASNKSDAQKLLKQLLDKLESGGRKAIDAEKLTFNDLADFYEIHYAKPAKYFEDRKIEGMRDFERIRRFLKIFKNYFGNMKLKDVLYEQILAFRNYRLSIPTHYKKPRNIATINRELSSLRRVFNIAIRQGWLTRNPVNMGEPLIDKSGERRRERILTLEEEKRLLAACVGKRKHLRPFIICLLHLASRKGETQLLRFSDLDFQNRIVTFQALNTKTLKQRKVAMTNRVYIEFLNLWENSDKNLDSLIFKCKDVRHSFESACKDAGIPHGGIDGLTLHCLRHTAASRLIKGQLPVQMVARILGHSECSFRTTYRYISANEQTLFQAASILESLHSNNDVENHSELIN